MICVGKFCQTLVLEAKKAIAIAYTLLKVKVWPRQIEISLY